MNSKIRTRLAAGVLLSAGFFGAQAAAQTIVIRNADVHTMGERGLIEDADVLIDQGRIVAVGQAIQTPAGAREIDAGGGAVTPGFIVAHSQLGLVEVGAEAATVDTRAGGAEYGNGPAFDVSYGFNPNSTLIETTRIEGVTRAVIAPSAAGRPFIGEGAVVALGGPAGASVARPRAAAYLTLGSGGAGLAGGARGKAWDYVYGALDEARRSLRPAIASSPLSESDYGLTRRDKQALADVIRGRRKLIVAVDREADIRRVIALKTEQGLDIAVLGGAEAWRVADDLAAAGIGVIVDPWVNRPGSFDRLAATLANAGRLHAAGVEIAFMGQDATHNARLAPQGAGIAVANGLPHAAALAALTMAPARLFGVDEAVGSIEPGKRADVVIWDGADPLEVTVAPLAVIIEGVEVPLRSRQTMLAERYKAFYENPARYGYE